jgi:hypothetical protein
LRVLILVMMVGRQRLKDLVHYPEYRSMSKKYKK